MLNKQIILLGLILVCLLNSACGDFGITYNMPKSIRFFKSGRYLNVVEVFEKVLIDKGYSIDDKNIYNKGKRGEKEDVRIDINYFEDKGGILGLENGVNIGIYEYIILDKEKQQYRMVDVDAAAYEIKKEIEKRLINH